MIALESPPITLLDARIVGDKVNPVDHHKQEFKRGEIGFVMSRGELMRFNECPVKWKYGAEEQQSPAMLWGDLVDCMHLVPEQFSGRFAVCPETYPDAKTGEHKPWNFNAKFCQQWRTTQKGLSIVKAEVHESAKQACAMLAYNSDGATDPAFRFQVAVWADYFDPATELTIPLRALVDVVPSGTELQNSLIDLKTTSTAEPRAWSKKVSSDHLDAQAALYLDLWNAATNEGRTDFRHIIQENEPPYHIELRLLSQEFIELGRLKYRSALKKYCQCLATGEWPGYDNGHHQVFGRWSLCEPEAWQIQNV